METIVDMAWHGSVAVAACRGELDCANVNSFESQLTVVLDRAPQAVVVDLGDVTFMDLHALGGFRRGDYRQPAFETEYPYKPDVSFAGLGGGKNLADLPWHVEVDYLGSPLVAGRKASMGHIETVGP